MLLAQQPCALGHLAVSAYSSQISRYQGSTQGSLLPIVKSQEWTTMSGTGKALRMSNSESKMKPAFAFGQLRGKREMQADICSFKKKKKTIDLLLLL